MHRPRIYLTLLIVFFVGFAFYVANTMSSAKSSADSVIYQCPKLKAHHMVYIKNDQLSTTHVNGHLCDTMTIVNEDNTIRLIAFGPHEHHVAYDGVTEEAVSQNQKVTITFNQ